MSSSSSRIFVYDTTLRDGSQGEGVSFSLSDKLHITQRLDEMGVDYIEGGYALSALGRSVVQHLRVLADIDA